MIFESVQLSAGLYDVKSETVGNEKQCLVDHSPVSSQLKEPSLEIPRENKDVSKSSISQLEIFQVAISFSYTMAPVCMVFL